MIFFLKSYNSFIFLIYICCNLFINKSENITNCDSIRSFKVTQTFPIINNKGKLLSNDTMIAWVYYYRDQILYNSAYEFNFNNSGGIIERTELRYRYFVYTKGCMYGSLFDKYESQYNKQVLVDSVLNAEWTVQSIFDPFINNSLTLLSTNKDMHSGKLNEKYSIRGKEDTSINGTVELNFSSTMGKGGFSFSQNLDSIRNMKLYRVFIVNNSRYIKEYGITLNRIEQFSDLEEVPVKNREEILKYFHLDKISNCQQE